MSNDGGPAFSEHPLEHDRYWYQGTRGMSLRDYFAGQALAAILTHRDAFEDSGETEVARMAYMQADAMLEIRAEHDEAVAIAEQRAGGAT